MKKVISLCMVISLVFANLNICCRADELSKLNKYPSIFEFFIAQDKYENINRKIFNFNLKMNKIFAQKIHIVWASIVPNFLITSLNLAYSNIEYPKKIISCLLQHDFDAIKHETKRFILNSTLGLAGLLDVADKYFELEPYYEDMEQGLAGCKVKCGNYIVLPFVSSTTSRDIFGRILDFAFNPTTYVATPIAAFIKMGLLVNRTAYIQPLIKMVESNFADPYDIARKFFGVEKYIKLSNYDRNTVLKQKPEDYIEEELTENKTLENLQVKGEVKKSENLILNEFPQQELLADIILTDYNPQDPILDSMRTALFDVTNKRKTIWHDISLWNRGFFKKIKTDEIELTPNRQKYKFKYVLQKDKMSPLAIIFPSIGEGVNNSHSAIMAKIFYDEGYSSIIVGSHFQWEFLKSLEKNYTPGVISQDVKQVNLLINNIIKYLSKKYDKAFLKRVALGTSLGAYTVLFLANEQNEIGANNIDKFIAICPPVDLFYAIQKIDKIIESWKNYPNDLKDKFALTTAKVIRAFKNKELIAKDFNKLPFSSYEAKIISAFIFHQKLSDLIYIIEKENFSNKEIYEYIYNMNYYKYIEKYLLVKYSKDELEGMTNLKSISNYLINKDNYKIFHSLDDYLTNKSQLTELKGFCDDKLFLFSNGSHLGFLYRSEFLNELKKEIKLANITANR